MIRHSLRDRGGGVILAVILVVVGGYYFLRNTLGLDLREASTERALWPVIAITIGAWIVDQNLWPRSSGPRA